MKLFMISIAALLIASTTVFSLDNPGKKTASEVSVYFQEREEEFLIDTSVYYANCQSSPAAAFNGQYYMVVWKDARATSIYGLRIDPAGTPQDTLTIPVSKNRSGGAPDIASNGTGYFIAYQSYQTWDIIGVRISASGAVLDTLGFTIPLYNSYGNSAPATTCGDTMYLVAWIKTWFYMQHPDNDISGNLVTLSGTVPGADITISAYPVTYEMYPAVAYDGNRYLVVWQDERYGPEDIDINGNFVSSTGVPSGEWGICGAANNQTNPSITYGGNRYLVVWEDKRNGSDYDIYGARITSSGSMSTFPIALTGGNQRIPAVAYDGTYYIVAWQDDRNGYYDIYGATVDTNGIVLNTYPISIQEKDQISPNLVRGPGNQILCIWSGWTDSINGHAVDTFRIWGKFYPFTSVEETPARIEKKPGFIVFPNPFHGKLTIDLIFDPNRTCRVWIYDINGRSVRTMAPSGSVPLSWNGDDDQGRRLSPGVYFIRLGTDSGSDIKKVILLD